MKNYLALNAAVLNGAMLFVAVPVPASAQQHSPQYKAVEAAVVDYVHREHGPEFNPTITCVKFAQDKAAAQVNYTAGPSGDPVATTVLLVRPTALSKSTARALLPPGTNRQPVVQGWESVRATTSPAASGKPLSPPILKLESACGN
jgi:hypothetical protein